MAEALLKQFLNSATRLEELRREQVFAQVAEVLVQKRPLGLDLTNDKIKVQYEGIITEIRGCSAADLLRRLQRIAKDGYTYAPWAVDSFQKANQKIKLSPEILKQIRELVWDMEETGE